MFAARVQELFDVEGTRLVTFHPSTFMHPGESVSMGTLVDRTRADGKIAVGFVTPDIDSTVVVDKNKMIHYDEIESLIALSGTCTNCRRSQ